MYRLIKQEGRAKRGEFTMTDLITDYISKRECSEDLIGNNYNCIQCGNIKDCYMKANSR